MNMNSDSDVFMFFGLVLTCAVHALFYLIALFVFLFLAIHANRRYQKEVSPEAMKQYKGYRLAAIICAGIFVLMLLIGAGALFLGLKLW